MVKPCPLRIMLDPYHISGDGVVLILSSSITAVRVLGMQERSLDLVLARFPQRWVYLRLANTVGRCLAAARARLTHTITARWDHVVIDRVADRRIGVNLWWVIILGKSVDHNLVILVPGILRLCIRYSDWFGGWECWLHWRRRWRWSIRLTGRLGLIFGLVFAFIFAFSFSFALVFILWF